MHTQLEVKTSNMMVEQGIGEQTSHVNVKYTNVLFYFLSYGS